LQNELNENKTNNSNLQKEIDSYKKENDSYKKDIDANKKEIDDLKKEIESLNTILGDWTKYDETERQSQIEIAKHKDDISKLQKDIDGLGKDKERLQSEINDAKSQIEKLKGEAFALAGTPKNYPAGHLYAGTDFVIGRYRIYGGSSNFVVYSSSGRLRVNIILGGRYGVDEYIYDFDDGDKIEASSSFTMVMVQ